MTEREALKLAFEALHGFIPYLPLNDEEQCGRYDKAITAIKEALAQPEQEPVAWIDKMVIDVPNQILYTAPQRKEPEQEPVAVWELFEDGWDSIADPEWMETLPVGTKLYIAPSQRKPLTDEEIRLQWSEFWETECHPWAIEFARAIEAAHGIKEKNCG